MAGFASSFEKAFVPAAKSSSDATLELLKEKIKSDAEKQALVTKSLAIDVAGVDAVERLRASGATPEEIDLAAGSLEAISSMKDVPMKEKMFLNSSKTFESLQKEKIKSAMREKQFGSQMDQMIAKIQELQGGALDSFGNSIDTTRQKIQNQDGSFSTEKTIGIEADGKFINIPTIVNGKELSKEDAITAFRMGINKPVGVFASQEEADSAAKQRSSDIGTVRGLKPSPVETTLSISSTGPKASFKLKDPVEMAKEQYDIRKLQREERESSPQFKQQVALKGIENELTKKALVDSFDAAQKANSAIDAFNSLKTSFQEGFDPKSIAQLSNVKELDDATLDAIFSQKKDALGKIVNAKLGKNPQAASFMRNVEAFSTLISRGGFDEKGTLTDKDRKVVVKAFKLSMANKEEVDNQFGIVQGILSKPSLRHARQAIMKLETPIENIDLPFGMKEKVKQFKQANPDVPDIEIVDFLIQKAEALSG